MRTFVLLALLAVQGAAPLSQDTGTVTGQIRPAAGVSVAGIRIAAMVAPLPGEAASEPATLERLTTTDSDGRYSLENVRPGRYYITAGFVDAPTYFPGVSRVAEARVVVVTAGSMLPGIDFALTQSAGVNVTGRMKGIPGNMPAGYVRVSLSPYGPTPRPAQRIDTAVSPDGTFQFQRVGPGTYTVLTIPALFVPSAGNRIVVKDVDVGPIELAIGLVIVGQVTVEDGSPLPSPFVFANAGGTATAGTPSLVSLVAIRSTNPVSPLSFGGTVRADGAFVVVNFQPGEYRIAARLPFGYNIKSLTYGDIDLLKTTLKITDAATGSVRMVLTKDPPPGSSGGVKVSGRVIGAPPPATAWISMQTSASGYVSAGAIGETLVRPDGTFEFQHVPPGAYAAQLMPRQVTAPQIAIVVEDVEVANIEIPNVPRPTAQTGPPAALSAPVFSGMPAPLAIQPPSYPPGVTVTGRVVMPAAANGERPRAVVFFGPRDGLSVQGTIGNDGTFEIQNVAAGNYDARTLPLMIPPVSTRVVVGDKDVSGITLNAPAARVNP